MIENTFVSLACMLIIMNGLSGYLINGGDICTVFSIICLIIYYKLYVVYKMSQKLKYDNVYHPQNDMLALRLTQMSVNNSH